MRSASRGAVHLVAAAIIAASLVAVSSGSASAAKANPIATCHFYADPNGVYTQLVDLTVSWSGRDPDYITPDESIRWAVSADEKAANSVTFTGASIIGSTVYFSASDPILLQFDKVTSLHTHTYVTFAQATCQVV